jgi:hypothetical protein
MSVYLGDTGSVLLRRRGQDSILKNDGTRSVSIGRNALITSSTIDTGRRRFGFASLAGESSLGFPTGFLITGDKVDIKTITPAGTALSFVSSSGWTDGTARDSGSWFVNVDQLGSVALYTSFTNSLVGASGVALPLSVPGGFPADGIVVNVVPNSEFTRELGQVVSFELNTNRDNVDTTVLGDEFRSQWSGLISGSGRMTCVWDYENDGTLPQKEVPHYLMQLVLRTEIGSEFTGRFNLVPSSVPAGNRALPRDNGDMLFYEFDGIISSAVVNVSGDNYLEMTAEFITSGPIRLITQAAVGGIDLEDGGELLLEGERGDVGGGLIL